MKILLAYKSSILSSMETSKPAKTNMNCVNFYLLPIDWSEIYLMLQIKLGYSRQKKLAVLHVILTSYSNCIDLIMTNRTKSFQNLCTLSNLSF